MDHRQRQQEALCFDLSDARHALQCHLRMLKGSATPSEKKIFKEFESDIFNQNGLMQNISSLVDLQHRLTRLRKPKATSMFIQFMQYLHQALVNKSSADINASEFCLLLQSFWKQHKRPWKFRSTSKGLRVCTVDSDYLNTREELSHQKRIKRTHSVCSSGRSVSLQLSYNHNNHRQFVVSSTNTMPDVLDPIVDWLSSLGATVTELQVSTTQGDIVVFWSKNHVAVERRIFSSYSLLKTLSDIIAYARSHSFNLVTVPVVCKCPFTNGLLGLKNLHNTCFVNSIIQSLTHISLVRQFVYSYNDGPFDVPTCVSANLKQLMCALWSKHSGSSCTTGLNQGAVSPRRLIDSLQNAGAALRIGVEDDAHWFLQTLLQKIQDELIQHESSNAFGFSEMFSLTRTIKCSFCVNHHSQERHLVQTLPLLSTEDNTSCSLQHSFHRYFKSFSSMLCEHCRSPLVNDQARFTLPSILCCHFDRCRWLGKVISRPTRSAAKNKVNTKVDFPMELCLEETVVERVSVRYRLCAIVVHEGLTPISGHYYALCRVNQSEWFKFDDAKTPVRIDFSQTSTHSPYLLFYERI